MFIHYPINAHRIPNLSPGLIFRGFIFGRIFELVDRGLLFGGGLYAGTYILDFTVLQKISGTIT